MILPRMLSSFCFIVIITIKNVLGNYCEFGTCDENAEYCCGENKCCKNLVDVVWFYYYWAAAVLLVIITTIFIAACFYMKLKETKVYVVKINSSPNLRILSSFCLVVIITTNKVLADYCEFGTCDENTEYCCGENKCCKKTVDVWYYWAAVLLVVITIIIAACLYMKQIKSKYTPYSKLEQQFDEVTTNT